MRNISAAEIVRQSESLGQQMARGEIRRLDRRRFLQNGALSVAGLAALSGVQLIEAPPALAQQALPQGSSPVLNLELLAASSVAVSGQPTLRLCRHAYRFDYDISSAGSPNLPPDLAFTYRLNAGDVYRGVFPSGPVADRLSPTLQPAPFQNPAAAPADPFPQLAGGLPPAGAALLPDQFLPLVCYRLVQFIDLQTFPVRRIARVYDWCSLYCFPGNVTVVVVGDKCLCYTVSAGVPAPPPQQKNVVNDSPQLADFWGTIRSGEPHSIGGVYYYTYNSQQGAVSTATWNANLNVPLGTNCRVDAFIPGSSAPANRTARAAYEISNIGVVGVNRVMISQQLATSQWVTLGTFPFRPGSFSVRLTDETGEPTGTRVVVADAVRWVSP